MTAGLRILIAEALGTGVLVLGGCGTAVLAGTVIGGTFGIALAFGLSLLCMAYLIGHISGCHINPAVTIGMLTAGKINGDNLWYYFGGQFGGGIIGAGIVFILLEGRSHGFGLGQIQFAANGFGTTSNGVFDSLWAVAISEIVMTFLFVLVVMMTTRKGFPTGFAPITAGLMLTLVHLISIPVDNTSVNPARSFAVAIFKLDWAIKQVWAFFVFPVIGAILAGLAFKYFFAEDEPQEAATPLNP